MANVQHSSLTDADGLHEPKGISTALSNQVYLSNGSGSGNWRDVSRLPGTGWGQYSNSAYTGTTYLTITDSGVVLPFDTNFNVTQLPISLSGTTSPLMNLSTETLLFVSEGDMHSITLSFFIATSTGSPKFIDLILNTSTDGITYATKVAETTVGILKGSAGVVNQFVNVSSLFPVSANMATNGARITLKSETTTTADIKDISIISTRVHKAR